MSPSPRAPAPAALEAATDDARRRRPAPTRRRAAEDDGDAEGEGGDVGQPRGRRRGRPTDFLGLKIDKALSDGFRRIAAAQGMSLCQLGEIAVARTIEQYLAKHGTPPPLPEAPAPIEETAVVDRVLRRL